jgi:DNA-binding NarL/FixJ family response regulator
VLVANEPRLMREVILSTLADQSDIEIIGEIQAEAEILPTVERAHPDFLIIALGESDQRPSICERVLEAHPGLRILAVAANRDTTICFWLSSEIRASRIETSEKGLLQALRGQVDLAGR